MNTVGFVESTRVSSFQWFHIYVNPTTKRSRTFEKLRREFCFQNIISYRNSCSSRTLHVNKGPYKYRVRVLTPFQSQIQALSTLIIIDKCIHLIFILSREISDRLRSSVSEEWHTFPLNYTSCVSIFPPQFWKQYAWSNISHNMRGNRCHSVLAPKETIEEKGHFTQPSPSLWRTI